jgi:hypothetical protein
VRHQTAQAAGHDGAQALPGGGHLPGLHGHRYALPNRQPSHQGTRLPGRRADTRGWRRTSSPGHAASAATTRHGATPSFARTVVTLDGWGGYFLVRPYAPPESSSADQRVRRSRRDSGLPPSAICPCAPGLGNPRTGTDGGGGSGHADRPARFLASELAFQPAISSRPRNSRRRAPINLFADRIRLRRPRRAGHDPDALRGEHGAERAGELPRPVPDRVGTARRPSGDRYCAGVRASCLTSAHTALYAESWMIPPRLVWKTRTSGVVPYLLRWFRFVWAAGVPWNMATRAEARDFCRWMRVAGKPARPHWRRARSRNLPLRERRMRSPSASSQKPPTGSARKRRPETVSASKRAVTSD